MTEVTDLDERIRRGEAIGRFLDDPDVQQVFRTAEDVYFVRWKTASTVGDREEIRAESRAFDALTKMLQGVVEDGQSAKHQLKQRTKPA